MRAPAKLYLFAIVILGFAVWGTTLPKLFAQPIPFVAYLLFVPLGFLSQIFELELTYKRWFSTSIVFLCAAIYLHGGSFATFVALISTFMAELYLNFHRPAVEEMKKAPSIYIYRTLFNVSQISLTVFISSLAFHALKGHPPPWTRAADFVPPMVAFIVHKVINTSLVSGIISLTEGVNFLYHLRFDLRYLPIYLLTLGILSLLFSIVHAQSVYYTLLLVTPIALVHYSLLGYTKLRRSAADVFEKLISSLAVRDPYTAIHSERVAKLAEKIARKLGLPEDEVERVKSAARIHDIGKVGVPDSILLKNGPLTDEEWEIMKKHPIIGAELIKGLEVYDRCIDIVKYEHERWNGSGYPEGLKGEEIPLGARIVAVADVYDALRSDRPYRKALSQEEAVAELKKMRGVKLDPTVVDVLLEILEEEGESWR